MDKEEILKKYDISGHYKHDLNKLHEFKLVLICDDSTSMKEKLLNGKTKWDELKFACEIVIDIAQAYELDCDVLFLNRAGELNVKSFENLNRSFEVPPYGNTPLTECFRLALSNNLHLLNSKKLLTIIFTDGCPTSDLIKTNEDAIDEFHQVLINRGYT